MADTNGCLGCLGFIFVVICIAVPIRAVWKAHVGLTESKAEVRRVEIHRRVRPTTRKMHFTEQQEKKFRAEYEAVFGRKYEF